MSFDEDFEDLSEEYSKDPSKERLFYFEVFLIRYKQKKCEWGQAFLKMSGMFIWLILIYPVLLVMTLWHLPETVFKKIKNVIR